MMSKFKRNTISLRTNCINTYVLNNQKPFVTIFHECLHVSSHIRNVFWFFSFFLSEMHAHRTSRNGLKQESGLISFCLLICGFCCCYWTSLVESGLLHLPRLDICCWRLVYVKRWNCKWCVKKSVCNLFWW